MTFAVKSTLQTEFKH